jgi:RNA polymerase-binding transcription factor DksA
MSKQSTAEQISHLEAERNRLQDRLAAIQADYQQGLEADAEERAQQLENAEVLEAISRSTTEELRQVEQRLAALTSA